MTQSYNYVTLDSANVPLISEPNNTSARFGEFVPFEEEEVTSKLGSVKSKDMFLPNFSLRAFEGKMHRNTVFYDQQGSGLDMMGSCIFIKGNVSTYLPGSSQRIESFNRSQNLKFDPNNELRHFCPAGTDLNFIHFSFYPNFFSQFLPEDEEWADDLRAKILRKERIVGDRFAGISLAQEQALYNIFNTPLTGKLGYMMIETSIVQVILLQMYALFYNEMPVKASVSNRDLDIIRELKDYLSKTFLDDHTLTSLAQYFGVNTNKLMRLFRETFGKSIFEYIAEQRMDYARKLLQEEGLLVTQVARNIGYKNPNHFSVAFKKRFGISPSVFR